jgi:YidC/Oxa1 family membrane protein insertase
MSALLGVPVDAAYHVVSFLSRLLTPTLGGLAAATAIILFTMAIRLLVLPLSYRATRGLAAQAQVAPQAQALRQKYARQPDRLQRELADLYRAEGTSMLAGFGPMLLQWPLLSVIYLLFRSPVVDGKHNALLSHDLFGSALGSHWLAAPGPLSGQGVVFAAVFVIIAAASLLTAHLARRRAATNPVPAPAPAKAPSLWAPARSRAPQPAQPGGAAAQPAVTRVLGWVLPLISVVIAAFAPLAAGLYLVTTAVWTLGERILLQRRTAARRAV